MQTVGGIVAQLLFDAVKSLVKKIKDSLHKLLWGWKGGRKDGRETKFYFCNYLVPLFSAVALWFILYHLDYFRLAN